MVEDVLEGSKLHSRSFIAIMNRSSRDKAPPSLVSSVTTSWNLAVKRKWSGVITSQLFTILKLGVYKMVNIFQQNQILGHNIVTSALVETLHREVMVVTKL